MTVSNAIELECPDCRDGNGEGTPPVRLVPSTDDARKLRILEALLFASDKPLDEAGLAEHISDGPDDRDGQTDRDGERSQVRRLLEELQAAYAPRGVNLVRVAGKWAFRTANDLGYLLEKHTVATRRLSKAALETLAIIAYHQPVTRAEIEEIRGVGTSKGTLDVLLASTWVRLRGRRRAPGRPVTYGTTEAFLDHFGLASVRDLPGLRELKGAGLLDGNLPPDFEVPEPMMLAGLAPDEDPLEDDEPDLFAGPEDDADEDGEREQVAGFLRAAE